jgi:hypothetical protein
MTIGDGLTLGMKAISHALHPRTVVTDAEVALLEDAEPGVELQNTRLMIAEELSLICGLLRFPNDLVELRGEGAEDPCHQDVVQSSLIDGWIDDVVEDVVIQGVATKREKHEVAPPLVVWQ